MASSGFEKSGIHENGQVQGNLPLFTFHMDGVLFIIDITIMLASVVGNICVIYFICGQKKSRSPSNITVVSISVADLLVACTVMPIYFAVSKYHGAQDELTPFLCKLKTYMAYWCKTVSIYSILAMCCDRYYRIAEPTKSHVQSGRYMFFLSFVWFFGAAYNIWQIVLTSSASFVVETNLGLNVTFRRCSLSTHFLYLQTGFLVVDFLVIFLVPLVIFSYFFVKIIRCVFRDKDHALHRYHVAGRRRIAQPMCFLVTFYLCHLPFQVFETIVEHSWRSPRYAVSLLMLFETVAFAQGVLNVVAYGSCSVELHEQVQRWCWRRRRRRRSGARVTAAAALALQVIVASPATTQHGDVSELTQSMLNTTSVI